MGVLGVLAFATVVTVCICGGALMLRMWYMGKKYVIGHEIDETGTEKVVA